jgi:hypothetical protein
VIVIVSSVFGLAIWIVLWAIGVKGIDAFMITLLLALSAFVVHLIQPHLPGNRE